MLQVNQYFQRVHGTVLFIPGLVGDCLIGVLFAARGEWQLLLWHFPLALIWAMGVNRLSRQNKSLISLISLNKWGLTALLLGAGSFPGFGSGAYSLAFLIARYLFAASPIPKSVAIAPGPGAAETFADVIPPTGERAEQSLEDDLYGGNTEARRAVVAKLSRTARPATTRLLRQLLSDSKAEIRSDASIALTRLDDEMSRTLHLAYAAWTAQPTDATLTLDLVDQYYRYAASNVLDSQCQRFYLVQARDLLVPLVAQAEAQNAQCWLLLARIRQRLGELPEALQDASRALQIQPDISEAALLAMELAFRTQAWETLITLAGHKANTTSLHADVDLAPLQWWTTLPTEGYEGAQCG